MNAYCAPPYLGEQRILEHRSNAIDSGILHEKGFLNHVE